MPVCRKCGRRYERNPWHIRFHHRCQLDSEKISPWFLRILLLVLVLYVCVYVLHLASPRW